MSTPLILKRSAVPGRVPTTGDLQLGELGLNTYDGRLYTRKDNGTASIIEIGASTTGAGTGDGLCVLRAGDTMSGELRLPASTTSLAPLQIPHGATPSVLENGDLWTTTTGLLGRINGSTRTFIHNGNPTALASDATQAVAEAGTATTRQWSGSASAVAITRWPMRPAAPWTTRRRGSAGIGDDPAGLLESTSRHHTPDLARLHDARHPPLVPASGRGVRRRAACERILSRRGRSPARSRRGGCRRSRPGWRNSPGSRRGCRAPR